MEEDMLRMIPEVKANLLGESSNSNDSSSCVTCSRRHYGGDCCNNNNVCWTKFKGVVPQHNGHWGAQIYANHQRIWLGTFKTEKEAATAYDSASIKLRSGDSHRNFPWTQDTLQEPKFQRDFTKEAILSMIKDGSYPSNFSEFLRNQKIGLNKTNPFDGNRLTSCRLLFQKELTPSDVGKLNRLVIPKKYAVKYFPNIMGEEIIEGSGLGEGEEDLELVFHDRQMRMWKFRYCYWKSSQSFVFTRGWNRFVRDKDLKANDVIAFYIYEFGERMRSHLVIDVCAKGRTSSNNEMEVDLKLGMGRANLGFSEEEVVSVEMGLAPYEEKRRLRLFGVQIV